MNAAPRQTEGRAQVANMYMLKTKYELKFPMTEMEEIKTFDGKIKEDAEFAADFVSF